MNNYGAAIFRTTTAVMQAEKELLKEGLNIKIIPTPREFSRDCGIAVRFDWTEADRIAAILKKYAIQYEALHAMGELNKQ
jgi:hypothetical protein